MNAGQVFSLEGHGGADFGTSVHELFAHVEWMDETSAEEFAAAAEAQGVPAEALDEVLACLRAPELATTWRRPANASQVEVWRERAFEVVLDGAWVTGVFDRVVIERNQAGQPVRATVLDFKTRSRGGCRGSGGGTCDCAARRPT